MSDTRYTALVLAASRGNLDPLAQAGGVSHKCFIDIAGQPMLRRVVEAVMASPRVGRTIVAIEPGQHGGGASRSSPRLPGAEAIEYVASRDEYRHQRRRGRHAPELLPLVITTGDNALHTAEMVPFFCDALDGVDGGRRARPHPRRATSSRNIRKGIAPSTASATAPSPRCNLYALLTPRGLDGAAGVQQRRPVRQEAASG